MAEDARAIGGKVIPATDNGETPVIFLSESERRSIAINGIFLLLALAAIYFASSFLIPVTIALLLSMLFSPVVRAGVRIGIPAPATAAVTVAFTLIVIVAGIYGLSGSANEWVEKIPRNFFRIEQLLESMKAPIEKIKVATDRVEAATDMGRRQPMEVRIERPGVAEQMLTGTPAIMASIGIVVMLLFFLLASGDTFVRKTVELVPALKDKKRVVEILRSIQSDLSYYLVMLTLINVTMGTVVAIVCIAVGIPNPILWGVVVTVLSFAPFAGAAVITMILAFVGLLTFSDFALALAPMACYLVIMFISNNLVMPYILGSRLALSPVAIFISIVFWGWMWGVVGALLAVPLLATVKIVSDRVDSLKPFSEFLSP
ncbi:MAG: AI-2E family transporter [Alphaproteobacteria bacterium]|nr:AI-2E family transporter [Alphaproteobacteria bacterium]